VNARSSARAVNARPRDARVGVRLAARWLAIVAPCLLITCSQAPEFPAVGPNVVLIVVDTLRADHLEQFGYRRETGEALRDFASHATRFDACYAPSPWTTPSTATILSGLHPVRHGSTVQGAALNHDVASLAEVLSDGGWQTAGFSFNHNVSATSRFDQGFDRFEAFDGRATAYPHVSEMAADVSRWMDDELAGRFLLYMQPMNTHGPYLVPEEHWADLHHRKAMRGFEYYGTRMKSILRGGLQGEQLAQQRRAVSAGMVTSLVEKYDSAVRYTTDQVGVVLDDLERRGLYDSSIIILTSDHGEELFDHGGFSHGYSLHREVLHVPLFIKLPGQEEARVVQAPVSLEDIYPTVVELLDLPQPYAVDGRSLVPLLSADPPPEDEERLLLFHVDWKKRCVGRSLQRGRFKLVQIDHDYTGERDRVELYDVLSDPGETSDLAELEPALVAELMAEMKRGFGEHARASFGPPDLVLDELDTEALRLLGYL
jgi:arylsulfatase A-like enzyme